MEHKLQNSYTFLTCKVIYACIILWKTGIQKVFMFLHREIVFNAL